MNAPSPVGTAPAAVTPEAAYQADRDREAARRDATNRARYRAANLSAILFFAALGCLLVGLFGQPWVLLLALAVAVGFVVAFARQARLDTVHQRQAALTAINEEGLVRLRRDWRHIPLREPPNPEPDHLYAGDLDLLGHASLQHLLSAVATPAGQLRLRRWLLAPAAPNEVRERQAAVAELARERGFRDEIGVFGHLSGMTQLQYERFLTWAEQGIWLTRRPWIVWLSRILPALTLAAIVAQVTGLVPYLTWPFFAIINLLFTQFVGGRVNELIDQVADRQGIFAPYAAILRTIGAQPFAALLLRRLQADLAKGADGHGDGTGETQASQQLRRLGRIMYFADIRMWYLFVVIQALTLWTFHVLWFLERWQRDNGSCVGAWLETLSHVDALSALGALAFDNPGWTFPELVEAPQDAKGTPAAAVGEIHARELGHPLLPPDGCVRNDVTLGPPGTFLLVTGSNMSGKSTLLRAIGVNVVLAQAGGPVCASEMRLPPVALVTSVRIQDSLEEGVSYFMAELRKLKRVVDATEEAAHDGGALPVFLLDEILHGTNTGERQIAARRVIRHLLAQGATGAVSTHDLTLADAPDLARLSQQVHFTEHFTRGPDGPAMTFDYRLRPGIASSTNALKLMEIVGLPEDDPTIEATRGET